MAQVYLCHAQWARWLPRGFARDQLDESGRLEYLVKVPLKKLTLG